MGAYAGVDWASEKHDLVVLDEHGTVLEEDVFAHDEHGISRLCGRAMVLAELARTDAHRFRVLVPDRDETRALRALTRAREDLVQTRVALSNQLRAELERFWPGAARIFAEVDSPIALAFLERYPTPADARTLGERRPQAFLARNSYCGRRTPAELLARLRTAPDGRTFLGPFRDTKSVITAATLLAEIGDCRDRYPTNEALAADAGMSAVAIESGKRKTAAFRRACDHRLRTAFVTLADSSRHHNPWARRLYTDARARGHTHQRAIRTLGRAWTRVLWRAWHDHTPYDPTKHRSLTQQLNTQG
jgi:transposase